MEEREKALSQARGSEISIIYGIVALQQPLPCASGAKATNSFNGMVLYNFKKIQVRISPGCRS
jgi:hypothetical protein